MPISKRTVKGKLSWKRKGTAGQLGSLDDANLELDEKPQPRTLDYIRAPHAALKVSLGTAARRNYTTRLLLCVVNPSVANVCVRHVLAIN